MTSSTSASRAGAGGLLALALLASGGAFLLRPAPAGPVVPAMASLAEDCSTADVVLLGNSKTRSDLPADELAGALDLPRSGVASRTVHGSSGPVWYAVAKNLVFGAGCRPRTVVAYGTLEKLLAADVAPDERVRLLAPVMSADEPLLQRKLFGASPGRVAWNRARQRAADLREGFLHGIAVGAVGLLARAGVTGSVLLEGASKDLLGQFSRITPTRIPLPQPGVAPAVAPPARVDDSFLPDLLALCAAHGARLAVVRAPLQSTTQEEAVLAIPGLVASAREMVTGGGGLWLDLSDLPLPAEAWEDDVHLGALGASRVTGLLARALRGDAAEQVWLLDSPPRFAAEPPAVAVGAVRPRGTRTVDLTLSGRQPLSDEACTEHEVARCCSPLTVARNGEPLPHTDRAAAEDGRGWYHAEAGVLVADGSGDPQVSLTPDRRCGGWWLYPGDVATLAPALPPAGTTQLSLRLRAADDPPVGALTVTARAGVEVFTAQVPLATGRLTWPLPAGQPVEVVLATSPDASFALLTEAVLGP